MHMRIYNVFRVYIHTRQRPVLTIRPAHSFFFNLMNKKIVQSCFHYLKINLFYVTLERKKERKKERKEGIKSSSKKILKYKLKLNTIFFKFALFHFSHIFHETYDCYVCKHPKQKCWHTYMQHAPKETCMQYFHNGLETFWENTYTQ